MATLKELTATVKEKSIAAQKAQQAVTESFMALLDATFDLAYAVGFNHGRIEKTVCDEAKCERPTPEEEETDAKEESDTTDTVEPTAAD